MQQTTDWFGRCAFIRDYFFGREQKLAQQLAAHLAERYVGDQVSELRPETDVSALMADSIRRSINRDDLTLVRDGGLFAEIDFKESITFTELVRLVQSQR